MYPVLIHLPFGLPLYAYRTMLCLSVLGARLIALRLAEREGMNPALMSRCAVWGLAGAVIGARLLFIVTDFGQIDGVFDLFKIWNGGMVAYGGFLGGFVGMMAFCRIHGIQFLDPGLREALRLPNAAPRTPPRLPGTPGPLKPAGGER